MNNGKICIPVCASTTEKLVEEMGRAAEFADVIELRFDYLKEVEPKMIWQKIYELRETFEGKILVTYRPKDQGGAQQLSDAQRKSFWGENTVLDLRGAKTYLHIYEHADWADLEHDIDPNNLFQRAVFRRIIWSYHDFNSVPRNLDRIYADLAERASLREGDSVKLAVQTDDITDGLPLWKLLKNAPQGTLIPIAMGDAGKWTRIMGPAFGAPLTYASMEDGGGNAPGQVSAKELIEVYRVKELTKQSRVYAIIGDPVSASLSPYMHNAAYVENTTDAVFLPMQVKDLDRFMREFVPASGLNFGGFAVTMPHKETIIPYLDGIDETARAIGAVNTVKFAGGKLFGFNTDAAGFIEPLKKNFGDMKGARVAILGAGGAARACVYALQKEGAIASLFVRDTNKAAALADEFGIETGGLSAFGGSEFDIVVNATPLGMKHGQETFSPLKAEQLGGVKLAYELIAKPAETEFVRRAKNLGIPTIGGVEMLIEQGIKQFEILIDARAPAEVMRKAAYKRL